MHVKNQFAVECVALDEYMPDATVDVIKMDVEGNELKALQGMQGLVARCQNLTIFAELHPTMLAGRGASVSDYLAMFKTLGFELNIIDESTRSLQPVVMTDIESHARDDYWHINLYALKSA